jgi:hypothetical protein
MRKPLGVQLRIAHCVLYVLMSQVVLNRSGVLAVVRKLIPGGMPEHVRMDEEGKTCLLTRSCKHFAKVGIGHSAAAFGDKDIGVRASIHSCGTGLWLCLTFGDAAFRRYFHGCRLTYQWAAIATPRVQKVAPVMHQPKYLVPPRRYD